MTDHEHDYWRTPSGALECACGDSRRAAVREPARSWSFPLHFVRPPRGLSANDRPHWATKHESTQQVRLMVMSAAQNIPQLERCRVDVEWVVITRHRRDTDNLAPFMKAIYDGIGADKGISAHIVPDDDPEHMEKRGATIRYDKAGPALFKVTITELTR